MILRSVSWPPARQLDPARAAAVAEEPDRAMSGLSRDRMCAAIEDVHARASKASLPTRANNASSQYGQGSPFGYATTGATSAKLRSMRSTFTKEACVPVPG